VRILVAVNPRYAGLADLKITSEGRYPSRTKPLPKGKKELIIGGGDASEFGFRNEKMWNYLSQVAKDPKSAVYSSRYRQSLLEAISKFEKKYRKTDVSPENIVLGAGVAGCYSSLHEVLLSPGDEVTIITPSHYYWYPLVHVPFLDAKRVASPAIEKDGWKPDFDDMRKRITSKTKALGITSPVNPTGRVYNEKELKEMVNIAGEFNIPVISDEIEGILTFDGLESVSMMRVAGDVPCVTVASLSKAFGSPGWSLGYICFHDPRGKISEVQKTTKALAYTYGRSGHRLPSPIMAAATKAFEEGWWIPDIISRLEKQRLFAWKRLNEIKGVSCFKSMGTLWSFPRVDAIGKTWKTTEDFQQDLWMEEGLGVVPGTGFGEGGFGHFRVTNLPPVDTLSDAYERLDNFISRHT
jgi:aspartate/methionine/tyrosine aminotransferase